jgi:5-methyltetrahydrofolate--homocysteine methyltransferase
MSQDKYLAALKENIISLNFDGITKAAAEAMEAGVDPNVAIVEGMVPGMTVVGDKYDAGEYFLSELVVAGEVMRDGLKIIVPYIKGEASQKKGKVVIATVQGDVHNLGKGIVITLLGVRGFEVIDLGTDVPATKIVDAVKEHKPDILGLSALLSTTMPRMGDVVNSLKAANLRDNIKVILGGAPMSPEYAEHLGADYGTNKAMDGVHKCEQWIAQRQGGK